MTPTTDELLALALAQYDQLRFRVERLEQGFQAFLADPGNPFSSAVRAKNEMGKLDDAKAREDKVKP